MPQGVGINKLFTKQTCSSFVKEKSCISPALWKARSIAALIGVNFRITLVLTEIIFVVLKLVSGPSS
ncbi:hypothetical protein HOLleu_41208 [Holothuria leucospilota]|uniref:Uncharacterized protein n=1 Tax=Holothuria leucospilota TaxID=206669 RepID=A0A9Q1BBY1_HOLLE|nr:hypothetical protein HOLleu_41208 [Holothuria leucospilota]